MIIQPINNSKIKSQIHIQNNDKVKCSKISHNISYNDTVVFKSTKNKAVVPLEQLISNLFGFFSKEDIAKSDIYRQYYSKKCGNEKKSLYQESAKLLTQIMKLFASFNIKLTRMDFGMVIDKYPDLNLFYKNKLKTILLKQNAIKQVLNNIEPEIYLKTGITFDDILPNANCKAAYNDIFNHTYVHPILKAEAITAKLSPNDEKIILKNSASLKNENIVTLENKKEKILEELNNILNSENWLEIGAYTKKQKREIKKKIIEYYSIKKAIGSNGLFNNNVEAIFANRNLIFNNLQSGMYIDSEGLVIGARKIQDAVKKESIHCTEFLQKENNTFKINLQYLDNNDDMQEFLNLYYGLKNKTQEKNTNLNAKELIDNLALNMINKRNNSVISTVAFKFDRIENLPYFYNDIINEEILCKTMDEFKQTHPNNNVVAFSADFFNQNSKRYLNAGMLLGFDFLEVLRRCDVKNIFLGAKAINSKRPPFPYYLRFGFKPILPSKEVLDHIIKEGTYNDYG